MNTDETETLQEEQPQTAVSVYGADGTMDDFPVLKAFQQYVDAEQSKARRRMVTLCILFGLMTCIMVGVFMLMLYDISMRNQQLNDRLVEYAMKDRDREQKPLVVEASPQLAAQNSANEAALKTMTDTLVALQKQISDQQKLNADQHRAALEAAMRQQQAAMQQQAVRVPSQEEIDLDRKIREASEKIRRARAILEAEKKKFQEEKERLHREEVERQRRRLYPEFYGEKQPSQQPAPPAKAQITDDDIQDILREADAPSLDAAGQTETTPDADAAKPKSDDPVIEYFKDDEYSVPVDVNGNSRNWQIPLN